MNTRTFKKFGAISQRALFDFLKSLEADEKVFPKKLEFGSNFSTTEARTAKSLARDFKPNPVKIIDSSFLYYFEKYKDRIVISERDKQHLIKNTRKISVNCVIDYMPASVDASVSYIYMFISGMEAEAKLAYLKAFYALKHFLGDDLSATKALHKVHHYNTFTSSRKLAVAALEAREPIQESLSL